MNSKWYWLIRQKYRNLKFQIKKAAFRLNERKESSERLSSFSRIVIRTLLVQVAINLVLVAVLYVGDKLLLSAMEIFAKTQTDPLIAALSESILVDIVIGGIGVAGVILGSAIRKISANNHFSNDPNFQNHYQKICTKQFKILQDIAAYNKDMLQYRFLDYMLQKLNNGFEPLRQEFGFVGRIITPLPRINYSQHLAEYHDGKINASQLGDVILKKNLRN